MCFQFRLFFFLFGHTESDDWKLLTGPMLNPINSKWTVLILPFPASSRRYPKCFTMASHSPMDTHIYTQVGVLLLCKALPTPKGAIRIQCFAQRHFGHADLNYQPFDHQITARSTNWAITALNRQQINNKSMNKYVFQTLRDSMDSRAKAEPEPCWDQTCLSATILGSIPSHTSIDKCWKAAGFCFHNNENCHSGRPCRFCLRKSHHWLHSLTIFGNTAIKLFFLLFTKIKSYL